MVVSSRREQPAQQALQRSLTFGSATLESQEASVSHPATYGRIVSLCQMLHPGTGGHRRFGASTDSLCLELATHLLTLCLFLQFLEKAIL